MTPTDRDTLKQTAHECLTRLRANTEQARQQHQLLRPTDDAGSTGELLRPLDSTQEQMPADQLLRPAPRRESPISPAD